MKIEGTKISMPRGDVDSLIVEFANGADLIDFAAGDELRFTVAKTIYDTTPLITKVATEFVGEGVRYELVHEDTKDLPYGLYVYDVRLFKNGKPYKTYREYSDFVLTGEVSR